MTTVRYPKAAELPDLEVWWKDSAGRLIDCSTASAWELKIGVTGSTAIVTKTTGITGAAGSGLEYGRSGGTPNVTISWDSDELDITAGEYTGVLSATFAGKQRKAIFTFVILDVIN